MDYIHNLADILEDILSSIIMQKRAGKDIYIIYRHASVQGLRDRYLRLHIFLHTYVCINIVTKYQLRH